MKQKSSISFIFVLLLIGMTIFCPIASAQANELRNDTLEQEAVDEEVEPTITAAGAIALIAGLITAGWGIMEIGYQCGAYTANAGGSLNGPMALAFQGAAMTLGIIGGGLFHIGFTNGWHSVSA